jgi:hypothetical protein
LDAGDEDEQEDLDAGDEDEQEEGKRVSNERNMLYESSGKKITS